MKQERQIKKLENLQQCPSPKNLSIRSLENVYCHISFLVATSLKIFLFWKNKLPTLQSSAGPETFL